MGQAGNELVDRLAKKGSDMVWHGPEPFTPLSIHKIRSMCREITERLHENEWVRYLMATHTKKMWRPLDRKRTKVLLNFSVTDVRFIISIITGHGEFNNHLFKLKMVADPMCRCQEDMETPLHLVTECPQNGILRWQTFRHQFIDTEKVEDIPLGRLGVYFKRLYGAGVGAGVGHNLENNCLDEHQGELLGRQGVLTKLD